MKAILSIDKSGRLILPKQIRESMHLSAGSKVEAELIGGRLQLNPVEADDPPYKIIDGIMVVTGSPPISGGVAQAVREERDSMADRALRRP